MTRNTGVTTRVLIVDDDEQVAKALARVLAGFDVTTELHAPSALRRITDGARFDVIVCDVVMPEMDGEAFFRKLEVLAPDQARALVFMTGGAFGPTSAKFLAEVDRPVLFKPCDAKTLRRLVEDVHAGGESLARAAAQ
jgi:CheY-like chemotaxis protein